MSNVTVMIGNEVVHLGSYGVRYFQCWKAATAVNQREVVNVEGVRKSGVS